jgi:hypothetical protein
MIQKLLTTGILFRASKFYRHNEKGVETCIATLVPNRTFVLKFLDWSILH